MRLSKCYGLASIFHWLDVNLLCADLGLKRSIHTEHSLSPLPDFELLLSEIDVEIIIAIVLQPFNASSPHLFSRVHWKNILIFSLYLFPNDGKEYEFLVGKSRFPHFVYRSEIKVYLVR